MTYPCILVEDGNIRIVGASLLKDGRYRLAFDNLIGVKARIDGETVMLHPADVELVYATDME